MEIIHLGEYWNEEKLIENRDEIVKAMEDYSKSYKRVYKYLAAAKLIHDDIEEIYKEATDHHGLKKDFIKVFNDTFGNLGLLNKKAKDRHLFDSAYTHKGHISFRDTYLKTVNKVYYIAGGSINIKSELLEYLSKGIIDRGYNVSYYHHPLEAYKIEAVAVPELDIAISTTSHMKHLTFIDIDSYIDKNIMDNYMGELRDSKATFSQLMAVVYGDLKKAKKKHDVIEDFYIPNVMFDRVDEMRENLVTKILTSK